MAQVDMFINIQVGGALVEGESIDSVHTKEIDVLSWAWGTSQTGSSQQGTGSGAGKAQVNDLTFQMNANKSCPNLWQMACGGTVFDTATLVCRRAGGASALEYMKVIMQKGLISNVTMGCSGDDLSQPISVSLNFGYVEVHYTPQQTEGAGDAEIVKYYDIRANKIG